MRLLLLALPSNAGRWSENLAGLDEALQECGRCDLAVVAEAFGQGFGSITDDPCHDLAGGWEAEGPQLEQVREMARRHHTAICFGFIERNHSTLLSSAIVIDATGETLALYRRMSPGWRAADADPLVYAEGTAPVCFELGGQRITIALCGDMWEMPEQYRQIRADLVLWPVFVTYTPEFWSQGELDAYAEQAGTVANHVALVNSLTDGQAASTDGTGDAHGGAAWFTHGKVAASLPMGRSGTLLIEA